MNCAPFPNSNFWRDDVSTKAAVYFLLSGDSTIYPSINSHPARLPCRSCWATRGRHLAAARLEHSSAAPPCRRCRRPAPRWRRASLLPKAARREFSWPGGSARAGTERGRRGGGPGDGFPRGGAVQGAAAEARWRPGRHGLGVSSRLDRDLAGPLASAGVVPAPALAAMRVEFPASGWEIAAAASWWQRGWRGAAAQGSQW
jgi:hypothetical protein